MNHPGSKKVGRGGRAYYDWLSLIDAQHAMLAKRLNCDRIATFDNDFDEISEYIQRLDIKIEYDVARLPK